MDKVAASKNNYKRKKERDNQKRQTKREATASLFVCLFLSYNKIMCKTNLKNNKLGAFIVPTGVGASVGGYAGDASVWARRFAKESTLIVNPNVVNAGCFSGITENMLYVEGYTMDEFFKGNLSLQPTAKNKVGVIFDKGIPQDVLNIHINTINAVKTVYDIDIIYEITLEPVDVTFFVDDSGISTGKVSNIETLLPTGMRLLDKGAEALTVVCEFEDDNENENYENGIGVDPIGGVEAIISHYLSRELKVPTAHAPAFEDFSISTKVVNPKASAEYITPTFLPCILIGLSQAPRIVFGEAKCKMQNAKCKCELISESVQNESFSTAQPLNFLTVSDLDFLVMPYNSLGSIPVFEAVKRGVKIYAVKENQTVLNVTKDLLSLDGVIEVETYQECLEYVKIKMKIDL